MIDLVTHCAAAFAGLLFGIWLERRHQARVQLARVWRRPR